MKTTLLILLFGLLTPAQTDEVTEHPQITSTSDEFRDSLSSSIAKLKSAKFEDGLETPGLGAMPDDQFDQLVSDIRKETPIPGVSKGQPGVKYDVILQPGHYGRPPGWLGTSGQLVNERALAAYITNIAAESLRTHYGLSVLVIPANGPFNSLSAKVFLAIHLDGSVTPCKSKASLGYKHGSSPYPMHALGYSLSNALGYSYKDFANDNFTGNEADYYMFSQVRAERLTGLLEVGELTCPRVEKQVISSADLVGQNIAYALNFIVKAPAQ